MSFGFAARLNGFRLAAAGTAAKQPSRLEESVVSLFEELRVPVLRYLVSFGVPVAEAEEIAQEVFLLLFQHLRQNGPCANPRGWIFRTAHNLAFKNRARAQRRAEHSRSAPCSAEIPDRVTPGPEERMQMIEHRERLLAIFPALPAQDRCCISLRAEGLRYREIADVLGISLGAVSISLQRSLSRLSHAGDR